MRVKQGGTKKFCPRCQTVTVCKSISLSSIGEKAAQRWYRSDHKDIQWFRRGNRCSDYGWDLITAELEESLVDELCELRDALGEIKKNAEQYMAESGRASDSLKELTASLEILRALDIYQKQL